MSLKKKCGPAHQESQEAIAWVSDSPMGVGSNCHEDFVGKDNHPRKREMRPKVKEVKLDCSSGKHHPVLGHSRGYRQVPQRNGLPGHYPTIFKVFGLCVVRRGNTGLDSEPHAKQIMATE